ncbi:ABC transporter permease subunit [Candidatus Saccharibacteria bacterium]|nr:ABC transporter permease subunit [Candidatus Saccharibacteria bacterium]
MWALIKWGLWQKRWFIMWWCIALVGFIFLNLIFYPSFKDQAAQLEQSFSQIPESTRALFSDTSDFFSPTGYLSSQVFYLMMPMLLGILAITLGSSLIAREEKDGTIELLMSRPVSRRALLAGKALVGVVILFAVGMVGMLTTVIMSKLVDLAVPSKDIALATLASTLLALSFGTVAYMITSFGKARVASVGLATLFALGGYIIVSLSGAASWLKWPSRAFPFHYYHASEILEGTYQWRNMLFIVAVVLASSIIAWVAFRRRDIA